MNIDKINEIKEKAIAEIEAVVKEVTKPKGRWKPDTEKKYYYLGVFGVINTTMWKNDKFDNYAYMTKNVFKSQDVAERYREIQTKIYEIASRDPVDYSNEEQNTYYFYFDLRKDDIMEASTFLVTPKLNEICSANPNFGKIVCKEIGEENLIWFFKIQMGIISE